MPRYMKDRKSFKISDNAIIIIFSERTFAEKDKDEDKDRDKDKDKDKNKE